MQRAEMTDRVWTALLALKSGDGSSDPKCGADAEQAAWALYAPLAAPDGQDPFLFAQVGQSLDGRVATVSGDAADVSGPDGLRHLHRCRALADAVVIGVRTALTDDPQMTVRLVPGPNPARIVIDPRGRLPDEAALLRDDGVRRVVVQACDRPRPPGVEVARLSASDGWISPQAIRTMLGRLGFRRVLIEGGGVTIAGFLEAGLLQRLHVGVAPLIIGAGPTGLRTAPVARLADALRPETRVYGLDSDVIFDCALAPCGQAIRSTWPTTQYVPAQAARRA